MSEVINATVASSCSSIDGWNVASFAFSTILYIVALGLFIYLPVRYWKKITWDQNPKNMIIVCLMSSFILGAVDNAITGVDILERYFGSCRRFDDDEIRSAVLGGVYMFFNSLRAVSAIIAIFERGWSVQEKKLVPIFVVSLVLFTASVFTGMYVGFYVASPHLSPWWISTLLPFGIHQFWFHLLFVVFGAFPLYRSFQIRRYFKMVSHEWALENRCAKRQNVEAIGLSISILFLFMLTSLIHLLLSKPGLSYLITSVVSFLHSVLAYIFIRRSIIKKRVDVVAESKKAGEDYKITKITFTVEQKIRICRCYFLCSCEE
ncbi:unnamed protein product [Caenorhabditis brenneri]